MVATDLGEYGVRVNCIAPGHIPTGITSYDLGPTIEADQPLPRRGTPQDVAEAVLWAVTRPAGVHLASLVVRPKKDLNL